MARHWHLYLVIAIPVGMVIVLSYIPMCGVTIAFRNFKASKAILGSPWVGLKYFEQFFSNPASPGILLNTVKLSLYSIVAGLPLPVLLAIGLNETKGAAVKKTVQMVTYAPYFISTVALVGMPTGPRVAGRARCCALEHWASGQNRGPGRRANPEIAAVDLVAMEQAPPTLRAAVQTEGREL